MSHLSDNPRAESSLPSSSALALCYPGFFECFNRQQYFEAHDVLERLWLTQRKGPHDSFYKGLIQLAGAFVHLQKDRLKPSAALLRLARTHLEKYSPTYQELDVNRVLALINEWLTRLETGEFLKNPLKSCNPPFLEPPTAWGSAIKHPPG